MKKLKSPLEILYDLTQPVAAITWGDIAKAGKWSLRTLTRRKRDLQPSQEVAEQIARIFQVSPDWVKAPNDRKPYSVNGNLWDPLQIRWLPKTKLTVEDLVFKHALNIVTDFLAAEKSTGSLGQACLGIINLAGQLDLKRMCHAMRHQPK